MEKELNMADIMIRNIPDDIAARIAEIAEASGQSREAYLRQRLAEIAEAGEIVPRWGDGFKCFAKSGGEVTLRSLAESISGGAKNLTEKEFAAYQRARLLADPRNGSKWGEARKVLEEAGFEVFNA